MNRLSWSVHFWWVGL